MRWHMSYEVWGEPGDVPECGYCVQTQNDYAELEKITGDLATWDLNP